MLPDFVLREAKRRETVNRDQSRKIRDDSHSIGLEGEYAFSKWSGIPMDLDRKDYGDGGRDFPWQTSIDLFWVNVKTTTYEPSWLLVEAQDLDPWTIYVLVYFNERTSETKLKGWNWGRVLMTAGDRGDFAKTGKDNYRLRPHQLRDMIDLMLAKI